MRNPSHQLNVRNGARDMPDGGIDDPTALPSLLRYRTIAIDLARFLGIARENPVPLVYSCRKNAKSTSYF
jgi:hypothetical protein